MAKPTRSNAKIYMSFFSLGEILVFWFILVDWKMIDPRDAGPWGSFFYLSVVFLLVFGGGGGFLAYVSKVLGRKKVPFR